MLNISKCKHCGQDVFRYLIAPSIEILLDTEMYHGFERDSMELKHFYKKHALNCKALSRAKKENQKRLKEKK